jgi:hypothetical protein
MEKIYKFEGIYINLLHIKLTAIHTLFFIGPIAQLWLERTPDKREVTGSTPVRPTVLGLTMILYWMLVR